MSDRLLAAVEAAERWAIHDPDPVTRGQVDAMVHRGERALQELFEGRLSFGTAGLRAAVGAGPNRMNALVVRQTTAGVMTWLQEASNVSSPVVVIGFDGRLDSQRFAAHACAAVIAAGGQALLAHAAVATPIVAHSVLAERADAGIVITASHNPPADNGYKLYLGDGRQIVAPVDDEIAMAIERVSTTWHEFGPAIDDVDIADLATVDSSVWAERHRVAATTAVTELLGDRPTPASAPAIVYTPMHGVGGVPTQATVAGAGFDPLISVASQFEPDGTFPTVAFPNPEEPGALNEALACAHEAGADAILAQDPDADRLALAVMDRPGTTMRPLSGDQLGVLLGDYLIAATEGPRLVARSVVSSRLLDQVAAAADVACAVTLTGFKWVARAVDDHPDRQWLFGYEEAIGYAVGSHVQDKDGITAALATVHMLADLADRGRTVWDRLDELALAHGVHESRPVTRRFDHDPEAVARLVGRFSANPPSEIAGVPVASAGPIGAGALPPTPGLELHTEDRTRIIVRPSGTEPKLKAYVEVIESVGAQGVAGVAAARADAQGRLSAVCAAVEALLS